MSTHWVIGSTPSAGATFLIRVQPLRALDNGRTTFSRLDARGVRYGYGDAPTRNVYPTRAEAVAALAAMPDDATIEPIGDAPPCPHCARERLLSTNLRLDLLRAAGMPADEVERAKASMERGEW